MKKVLITGASGDVGTRLRKLLKGVYPEIRISDIKKPADLRADEDFVQAELANMAEVEKAVAGIDGIVHLGGFSVEGPWETILNSNIVGCYNLFEAARKAGVKRVIFATSNHAVGFYPRRRKIGTDEPVRPDSRYGVSKAFGEALGAMYAYKHGLQRDLSAHRQCRRRADRSAPAVDLAASGGSGAAHPHRARASRHPLRDFLRRVRQSSAPGGTTRPRSASAIGRNTRPRISASRRSPRRPSSPPIRSATGIRAARSAATNSTPMPASLRSFKVHLVAHDLSRKPVSTFRDHALRFRYKQKKYRGRTCQRN